MRLLERNHCHCFLKTKFPMAFAWRRLLKIPRFLCSYLQQNILKIYFRNSESSYIKEKLPVGWGFFFCLVVCLLLSLISRSGEVFDKNKMIYFLKLILEMLITFYLAWLKKMWDKGFFFFLVNQRYFLLYSNIKLNIYVSHKKRNKGTLFFVVFKNYGWWILEFLRISLT